MTEPRTEAGRRLQASDYVYPGDGLRDAILAIEAEAAAGPRDEGMEHRAYRIVERAANMGSCSQTHHEHLARDADKVLAALAKASEDG